MHRNEIKRWAEKGTELTGVSLSELPGINLYMDQVISLLGEKLEFYQRDEGSKLLTSSMINNYVKSEVIPHPEKKKYNKDHLASLIVVCLLKQVISIPDIKTLLSGCSDMEGFYSKFEQTQTQAINEVSAQLRFAAENGDDLRLIALKFAAEANAKRAAAERILVEIDRDENRDNTKTQKSKQPK